MLIRFFYIHIYIYLIQVEYRGNIQLDRPGGMREAIRRPSRDGVLDCTSEFSQSFFPDSCQSQGFGSLNVCLPPPKSSPRRPAHSAGPTHFLAGFAFLAPLGPKKWRSKRPSKTDQILMPFQHRFLSVLAPFWRAKMAPKTTKNR